MLGVFLAGVVQAKALGIKRRVVIIKSNNIRAYNEPLHAFLRSNLNATFEVHDLLGSAEIGRKLVSKLKAHPPDLIFALGRKAATLSVTSFSRVPVIFAMVLNWRRHHLKRRNSTGISLEIPGEIQFTQFKMVAPRIKRVGVFYNPEQTRELVNRARPLAQRLGITLIPVPVHRSSDLKSALNRTSSRLDALWMIPDATVFTLDNYRALVAASWRNGWPFMAYSSAFVQAGALLSVSPNYRTIGSQAGVIARRILEDRISVSTIVVASPIGTEVIFNADVAKRIRLKLAPSVYSSIDKVVYGNR